MITCTFVYTNYLFTAIVRLEERSIARFLVGNIAFTALSRQESVEGHGWPVGHSWPSGHSLSTADREYVTFTVVYTTDCKHDRNLHYDKP